MTSTHPSQRGATWFRAALQVNPYEYIGHPAPKDAFKNEQAYNTALLDECEKLEISILAITDHWRASTASGLIKEGKRRGIIVLPGFEANCKEGFHLLVIFESETEIEDITAAIGACGAPADDPHGPGTQSFTEIVTEMRRRGAVVIPAHTNVATSGLLHRASGKPLQNIVSNETMLAIGTTPSAPSMRDQEAILKNRSPYRRRHPLVEIHADDISHPSTLATEGATTWFKMAKPSLKGLQHALRTPQTRVSLTAPQPFHGVRLTGISWKGGFLDGLQLPIGSDLTALIGGRGTGKSTVIESIRFVLNRQPSGEAAKRDHQSVVNNVLGAGAIVRLEVDVHNPDTTRYVIQRTVGETPCVYDASGSETQQTPLDIVGDLELFGQHELAELAQDKNELALLIRRLGGDYTSEKRRPEVVAKLKTNRDSLAEIEDLQGTLEAELADIPRLEEQAKKFAESDLGSKLDAQRIIADEEAIFVELGRRITSATEKINLAGHTAAAQELQRQLAATDPGPRDKYLTSAQKSVADIGDVIEAALASINAAIERGVQDLASAKSEWDTSVQPDRDAHSKTVRELVSQGYNPDVYLKTTGALKALTLRLEDRRTYDNTRSALVTERETLIEQLAAVDAAIDQELIEAIRATNSAMTGMVVIKPVPSPDRRQIKAVIDRHFSTHRSQIMAAIDEEAFSVCDFIQAIRSGTPALSVFGVTGAQASNLIGHGEALLRELEDHSVGRAVDVHLNVAPDRVELRKLDDLSKGQRATALLLLLLGVTTSPLIIDQPEDDLDNRFVYDGVVQYLRDLKNVRQILVSTHNANVPVLGDAELVVVMESDGRHGTNATGGIGSLDEGPIRDHAERLLEGGEEAFRARRHLYGF